MPPAAAEPAYGWLHGASVQPSVRSPGAHARDCCRSCCVPLELHLQLAGCRGLRGRLKHCDLDLHKMYDVA